MDARVQSVLVSLNRALSGLKLIGPQSFLLSQRNSDSGYLAALWRYLAIAALFKTVPQTNILCMLQVPQYSLCSFQMTFSW
jgi:hypothetical protein